MRVVYRLREDTKHIDDVQRAARSSEYGSDSTHGPFGSDRWFSHIESGLLPLHTIRGTINPYMPAMNDWPEFELRAEDGSVSRWTREANSPENERLYQPGRRVELDYVMQRHRPTSWDSSTEHKVIVEIRIGEPD